MSRITILGVPVDCLTQGEALRRIEGFLRQPGQRHVATPNPEMIVEAQRNPAFKQALQQTALNLPDGIGLVWAMKKRGGEVERVTGVDTMIALCRSLRGERVFLLGAAAGVAERAATALLREHPHLRIAGMHGGSPRREEEQEIIDHIHAVSPTILFVAYGAPVQDLWIARNLPKLPTVKLAMGVGGAFDFLAGIRQRAPRWMQQGGIEWLWRLLREPRRVQRIWNAVVVFPWLLHQSATSPSPPPVAPGSPSP
jgi:N-acetylglucosaminyldiphosphoundecaprenol N-acetyl-beta-D-mannosaminyltransferase